MKGSEKSDEPSRLLVFCFVAIHLVTKGFRKAKGGIRAFRQAFPFIPTQQSKRRARRVAF